MTNWTALKAKVYSLIEHVVAAEAPLMATLEQMDPALRLGQLNLIHYLALRQLDVRPLQLELSAAGLSSLNSCESRVLSHLQGVHARLVEAEAASGEVGGSDSEAEARRLLRAHSEKVFGPRPSGRHVYIMVTAPTLAEEADPPWFDGLLKSGMNLFRINTAHGTPRDWEQLIAGARSAGERHGLTVPVLIDLPGPKLRTTTGAPLKVLKIKPERDDLGRILRPATVHLSAEDTPYSPALLLPPKAMAELQVDDVLRFQDTRGKKRSLRVTAQGPGGATALLGKTAYIGSATVFTLSSAKGDKRMTFSVSRLPEVQHSYQVPLGGSFVLARHPTKEPGDAAGVVIGCSLPQVFRAVKLGHRIFLDDGKITAVVTAVGADRFTARIEQAQKGAAKLRGDMGINLPDSHLDLPPLSSRDEEALAFAEQHAALVGLSFIRSAADVQAVASRLIRQDLGLVLKIETQSGFQALPEILLQRDGRRPTAVMIARGDLAAECGFERLAELQEEILWLCEAAHVPVIWATQVLETLAKTGVPTRAEVTDAAMAVRAECVMLNKGPHVIAAVATLASILQRMESHQYKKRQLYRPLAVAGGATKP